MVDFEPSAGRSVNNISFPRIFPKSSYTPDASVQFKFKFTSPPHADPRNPKNRACASGINSRRSVNSNQIILNSAVHFLHRALRACVHAC